MNVYPLYAWACEAGLECFDEMDQLVNQSTSLQEDNGMEYFEPLNNFSHCFGIHDL